jgi:hypothetical protein
MDGQHGLDLITGIVISLARGTWQKNGAIK